MSPIFTASEQAIFLCSFARDSDPRLTFGVYAKAHIHDLAAAVEGLPINLPGQPRSDENATRATGTDGKPNRPVARGNERARLPFTCRKGDETCKSMRHDAAPEPAKTGGDARSQTLGVMEDDVPTGKKSEDEEGAGVL